MRFDHVGIAVEDADTLTFLYEDLFGCEVAHEERFRDMKVVFLELGCGYMELLEPLDGGVISRYLDTHGPGTHHIALATDDIEAALDAARERNVELVDEEPRQGSWGHRVAFLHPNSTGGILFEFVERS